MTDTRYLPAEWAPQYAVMLTWPHAHCGWKPILPLVEPVFIKLASEISRFEKVLISCYDKTHLEYIAQLLKTANIDPQQIMLFQIPSNDSWARDHGPITVLQNKAPLLLDFIFNGWGNKYHADLDNQITQKFHSMGAFLHTPLERIDLVLEGGSIDSDGAGSLLTTTHCLLSDNRNPGLTKEQIETRLKHYFGIQRILWLEHGYLAGDDTDSHIDMLARFCNEETIAYIYCDDPEDEHYEELKKMENELAAFRTRDNKAYHLVPLPFPAPKINKQGERLPASYANFLIINGAVLMPTYDDQADAVALEKLRSCFSNREVIGIPCLPLIMQYGSLHCVTMQIPAGII